MKRASTLTVDDILSVRAYNVLRALPIVDAGSLRMVELGEKLAEIACERGTSIERLLFRSRNCGRVTVREILHWVGREGRKERRASALVVLKRRAREFHDPSRTAAPNDVLKNLIAAAIAWAVEDERVRARSRGVNSDDVNAAILRPFTESAENRKALDGLVRDRRKNIEHAIDKLDGLRASRRMRGTR